MFSVSRNDPCPCGSGKKYKKCCLLKTSGNSSFSGDFEKVIADGFACMGEEKWAEAIAHFKVIEEVVVEGFSAPRVIATCYDVLEDFPLAVEYYEKALETCRPADRFEITNALGVARACLGRFEEAIEAFRQCVELTDDHGQTDDLEKLVQTLEKMRLGQESPHVFLTHVGLQRAFSEMEEERYEDAAQRLEKLKELDPENDAIFYNLGVVYTYLRKEDLAFANYEKAVRLNPRCWQAWYNIGQVCLIKTKDLSRALHCFDRALSIVPDYISAHHQRGVAYELLGDHAKAVQCWERTLMLDPENRQALESIQRVTARNPARFPSVPE